MFHVSPMNIVVKNRLYSKFGIIKEKIKISIPNANTIIVFDPAPFHSFRTIPHTLLNVTFSDIRMLHEKAIMILPSLK